jgi:hypothetical protein
MNRKLLLWLMVPFVGLLLSEPLLRLADPPGLQYYRRSKMVHAYHPDYTISLRPSTSEYLDHPSGLWEGQFTVNSYGMRDLEEPQPGRSKTLCLGDSLAMGHGVGDGLNFCHLLKAKAGSLQVLNASVDGFGTYAYALRTEEIVSQIDSVKTVLLFPSPTDWWIPKRFRERGILPDDEKDLMRKDDTAYKNLFRAQFKATEWFYTLQALKLSQEQLQLRKTIFANDLLTFVESLGKRSPSEALRASTAHLNDALIRKPSRCSEQKTIPSMTCPEPLPEGLLCSDSEPDYEPLPEFTQQNLNRLIHFTRAKGIRLVVVLLPMQEEEIRCAAHGKFHENGLYAVQARRFFKEKGIDVIDLMPYTKSMCRIDVPGKEQRIGDFFLREDGHLTELGNRWAADALMSELSKRGLYPEAR